MEIIRKKGLYGRAEYQINDKGQMNGLYRYWWDNGQLLHMDQIKKGDGHGITIEFRY